MQPPFVQSFGERPSFRKSEDFGSGQSGFAAVAQQHAQGGFGSPQGLAPPAQQQQQQRSTSWERHAALPAIITGYVQALFNLIVVCCVLAALYWFATAIQQDIDLRAEGFRREVMSEIQTCAREYTANRCDPADRIPAMQKTCEVWKNCMQQDPFAVARGKISAHTLAEIINSFVEPISYKTMIFVCLVLVTVIVGSNVGFGIGRRTLSGGQQEGSQVVVYKSKKQ
jgi:hypothetical protein